MRLVIFVGYITAFSVFTPEYSYTNSDLALLIVTCVYSGAFDLMESQK